MKIFSYKKLKNEKVLKFFGVTLYKQKYRFGFKVRSYLFGLFKIKSNSYLKKYYILGIQFYKKYSIFTNFKKYLDKNISNRLEKIYWDMRVLSQVQSQHSYFINFKRKYEGQDVVLVACGPTSKIYKPIKGAIHVGMNAGVYLDNIKFDYLFVNDFFTNSEQLNEDIEKYIGNNCKKFYGIPSPHRLAYNQNLNKMAISRIPQYRFYEENTYPYLLLDSRDKRWAINLECEPLGDIGGTAYSALQFILYTNPRRIFLVGCDCNVSYSESSQSNHNYSTQYASWESFKTFAETIYPKIEIISVNPVGLKGLFKDYYTDNQELMVGR